MAKDGQLSPRELRQTLLDLSSKQSELRRRLLEYRVGRPETLNALAIRANTSGHALKKFIDGTLVLSGGRGLPGLCEVLQCNELGREIAELAEAAGARNLGFANHSSDVIGMAFDLIEFYHDNDRSEKYTTAEFAAVFGDDAEIVLGVLSRNPEEVAVLGDEQTRERLMQVLIDNQLDEHLEVAKERFAAQRRDAAARLKLLVEALSARAGGVVQLARMLNTPRNSLYYAVTGQASLKTINELIGKAEKLAEMMGSTDAGVTQAATQSEPASQDEAGSVPGIPAELEAIGGQTLGDVKYVLTAASFQQIHTVALVDLREELLRLIPVVRLLLNYGSQLSDGTAREILREDPKLARELRELDTAVRLFTFEDPGALLEVYDDDRAHSQGKPDDKHKGKKERS